MPKIINHGVIEQGPRPKDWRASGVTGLTRGEVLRADGQWDSYLPVMEKQYNPYFDTMACVSFGNINCPETLMFRQFGKRSNFSDRFIAKMSGTTHDGNGEYAVAETIRKCGLVEEEAWPFGPWIKDWDTYYSEVPQEVKDEGLAFLKEYELKYQFIDEQKQDALIEALKYSPLAIFVPGHCMTLYGYELGVRWKIYDTYGNGFKEEPWDYKFRCAVEWQINKIIPSVEPMIKLPKNGMVVVVDGHGERMMSVDGKKLYLDDPGKIETELQLRNAVVGADGVARTQGYPVAYVKTADVATLSRVNLKNEPV